MQTTVDTGSIETNSIRSESSNSRSIFGYLIVVLKGFCMGAADVVPGVSGGTMALIMGIYEELISSIRMIGQPQLWRALLRFQILKVMKLINVYFLAALFVGIVVAIVTLAPYLEWLLEEKPVLLWSFFFGLIIASVLTVGRRIKEWTPVLWMALIIGTILAFVIVGLVPTQTPESWWFLIVSSAFASCAMILPGISGAFILVLIGKYQFALSAVNDRDIISIGLIGLGAAVGLVTFAQLLGWLFKRFPNVTLALLTGLMAGSLRKIWPWKETLSTMLDRHGEEIPIVQRNILPALTTPSGFNMELIYAIGLTILGFVVVIVVERLGNRGSEI